MSITLKVRDGIISQVHRYLGGFYSSQRIFLPQTIQVLLTPTARAAPVVVGTISPPLLVYAGSPYARCRQALVVGRHHGGHDAMPDGEGFVQHLRQRRQAVRRTGGVGDQPASRWSS